MAQAFDITNLVDVKSWLTGQNNVIGTTDDTLLTRLISAASQAILTYLSRPNLISASYVDIFDGNGKAERPLLRWPVTAIASVTIDAVVIPQSTDRIISGWYLDTDDAGFASIVLIGCYRFCRGRRNCAIAYTAGYANQAALPSDLQQAAIDLVALKYRRRKSINMVSEVLAQGMSTTFSQKDMTDDIKTTLNQYRRML